LQQFLQGFFFPRNIVLVELVLFHELGVVALKLPENIKHCVFAVGINVADLDFLRDGVVGIGQLVVKVPCNELTHGFEGLHVVDLLPQEVAGYHCRLLEFADLLHFAESFLHIEGVKFLEFDRVHLIVEVKVFPELLFVHFFELLRHVFFLLLLN
jgi:hypothetical protein